MSDEQEWFDPLSARLSILPITHHPSPLMRTVSAICFDLDNTLWDVWPAIVRAEQEMYAFLNERYPRLCAKYSIEALRAERERVALDEPHMSHDFTYLRLATLRRCAQAV